MTDYREQAIRDVAEALGIDAADLGTYMQPNKPTAQMAIYAVAQRERVLELEAQLQAPKQELYDTARCQICGWPFAQRMEDGCVPGSCGMRPREYSEEWFRLKERREWLQKYHPAFLQLQQKEGERG